MAYEKGQWELAETDCSKLSMCNSARKIKYGFWGEVIQLVTLQLEASRCLLITDCKHLLKIGYARLTLKQ